MGRDPVLKSLQATWTALSVTQRLSLGLVVAMVFGGILMVSNMAGRPTFDVLFSNLEADDAGAVTAKLKELKVPYEISQGGRAITVPTDKVYDLRLQLASEGLPRGGNIGFEIFDKQQFGQTDFTQRLNYQRALQGELSRTIDRLDGVLQSRVHLVIPEQRLFTENQDPATASIVLHLRPGARLDEHRVSGIVHLVSSSVEALKPENVSIHDAEGNLLSAAGSGPALTGNQLEMQAGYEKKVQDELKELADQVLGPGKSAIKVSAELNWDQTETTSEKYTGGGRNGAGVPLETTASSETYQKSSAGASGLAGTPSNLQTPPPAAGAQPGGYQNRRDTSRYAVDKVIEKKMSAPGNLKRVSVAVLVDDSVPAGKLDSLKNVFATAAGLDTRTVARGGRADKIELMPMAFDKSAAADAGKEADRAAKLAAQQEMIRNGAAVAVAIVLLIASLIVGRRLRAPQREPFEAVIADAAPLGGNLTGAPLGLGGGGAAMPEREPALVGAAAGYANGAGYSSGTNGANGRQSAETAERVRQLASDRPDEVARQVQRWLSEN